MTDNPKKGWHPDPFGRYAERYFFADDQPGRLVRDDGRTEFYDDVTADDLIQEAAETEIIPSPVTQTQPPPLAVAPVPSPPATTLPPVEPQVRRVTQRETPVRVVTDAPHATDEAPVAAARFPDEPMPWGTRMSSSFSKFRRGIAPGESGFTLSSAKKWGTVAAALLLALVVLLVFVVLPSGPKPSSSSTRRAPVTSYQLVPSNFLNGGSPSVSGSTTTTSLAARNTSGWRIAQSFATSSLGLDGISCATPLMCMAVGETSLRTGLVMTTSDGGTTWTQVSVPSDVGSLNAVSCATTTWCMAVGGLTALSTTDGGGQWTEHQLGTNELNAVSCAIQSVCTVAAANRPEVSGCDSGTTYTTADGGSTWSRSPLQCFVPAGLACISEFRCELAGAHDNGTTQEGQVYTTANGGTQWHSQLVLRAKNTQLSAISCTTSGTCVAVGNSPTQAIMSTTNFGTSWVPGRVDQSLSQRYFLATSCVNAQVCQVGGSADPVSTADGGATWSTSAFPPGVVKITAIACPSATCVAVADTAQPTGVILVLTQ